MDIAFERRISRLGKWLDPIDALAMFAPELIGVGERFPVEPEVIIFPDLAELRVGRDRDYCPARHGGSSSAGDAGPHISQSHRRLFRPAKPLQYLFRASRVSDAPAANSHGLRSMQPASGLPHAGAL